MDQTGTADLKIPEQLDAGLTCAERRLSALYQSIDFGRNEVCRSCRRESPGLMRPVGAWAVGKNFYLHEIRLLFVGKNARGEPGDLRQGFRSGFRASRDWLWRKQWPYWSYTRKITENVYGDDNIENIAFTNIVKCNDSMGRDTTSSVTKDHCICELNVIGREIAIIDPTHIVFYTSRGYDDHIRRVFDSFETVRSTEIAIGRKKMPWLEATGACGGRRIHILRAGHPERMKKTDYVSAICEWVHRTGQTDSQLLRL